MVNRLLLQFIRIRTESKKAKLLTETIKNPKGYAVL